MLPRRSAEALPASSSRLAPEVQSLAVHPESARERRISPMCAIQMLGMPVPRSRTSTRSQSGSTRASAKRRRRPQILISSGRSAMGAGVWPVAIAGADR